MSFSKWNIAEMTSAAGARSHESQPKERWFSNHRPSNRDGAAKPQGFDAEQSTRKIKTTRFADSAAFERSVVGKPPFLGPRATLHRNSEPRHLRPHVHNQSSLGPRDDRQARTLRTLSNSQIIGISLRFFTGLIPLLLILDYNPALLAQEQVDKAEARGKASTPIATLAMHVRVTKAAPEQTTVRINWRHGGEGLGGTVVKGEFLSTEKAQQIPINTWTDWLPMKEIVGPARGWEFPTLVVASEPAMKGKSKPGAELTDVSVDFEFAENGKVFRQFTEIAPKGATVGFAFPASALGEKVTPEFTTLLNGLSGHARLRRERLEKAFPDPAPMPKLFGIIGHVGGYGDGSPGLRGGSGYGVRHCNPAILSDEFRTLGLLGVNGLVGSVPLADAAGVGANFRHIYWGGPGSGSPMGFFRKSGKSEEPPDGCPFDPQLKTYVMQTVDKAIEEHRATGAKESWALWDDEIGVYAKDHIAHCDRCAAAFRAYLQANKVSLAEVGGKSWDEVQPFNLWVPPALAAGGKKSAGSGLAPAPENAADSLRYYYTYRLMTHATGQVFSEAAAKFGEAGIKLYAMQGPTPSWNGASLDWNEFYDLKANTAFVFETSNRDARAWPWESYLADIGRGIAARNGMAMGCLVKPHRGAPAQRMLSVVSRGATTLEWYTYGPDYSKGDSFSQSPDLLEQVARSARFLGRAEPYLYGAKFATAPEVAFVTPRSSEIWSRVTDPNLTTFENAKWIYLALVHAHVPLDILSEQQLAEGKLDRYKVIYIPGTHLRRDSAAAIREWVRAGGTVWTDATGLSRDEANQPATAMDEMLGLTGRQLETWGSVEQYRATELKPLTETNPPAGAEFGWDKAKITARIARESLRPTSADVLASFADGKPAVTRNRFGKGEAIVAGLWSGVSYSGTVRRADFDMHADFDPTLRALIAAPALTHHAYRPAIPSDALVEAVALDKDGQRSIALINWSYRRSAGEAGKGTLQPIENLRVELPGFPPGKSVRSLAHGPLKVSEGSVTVPKLAEIDLLVIE